MSTTTSRAGLNTAGGGDRPRRHRSVAPRWLPYLLLLPALVFELLVHIVPMLTGIWISGLQLNQFFIRRWLDAPSAGLDNYRVALNFDGAVGEALLNSFVVTFAFTLAVLAVSWTMGMFAAVMLQRPFRGRGLIRTLFLIPYAIPVYAGVIVWKFMLGRDNGMVNTLLAQLGIGEGDTFWLLGDQAFWSTVVVAVWRLWPFAFLTLTAGLQSVPDDVYEAASVDGAGLWRQFRSLTLPMLAPVNQVLLLVLFLWTFNDFNVPYILFGQSVPRSADLLSIHVYQSSFITWNFGVGSAMSVLLLLVLLVITAVYLPLTNRRVRDA
ncbi:carbohydrate ABC transporter permease [Kineococcus sp. TBRC 1896]|uniref:Carbohydrate ABC transporter permease n=1 Tax=Kineococcus mangrovi TaxID=1660183 RepID=A0ABV4I9M2_9ACTN